MFADCGRVLSAVKALRIVSRTKRRGEGGRSVEAGRILCSWAGVCLWTLAVLIGGASADPTYTKNKKANRLYAQEKYDEALKIYEDALLESPGNQKLLMNKGSTQYRLGDYEKAEESYQAAASIEDKKARADLFYNLGNTLYRQGEQLEMSGNPAAAEKYKAAYENFIKALDLRPKDMDAKWNLQLAYQRMQKMQNEQQQQQQNQQNNQKNQNQQNEQNQQGRQNQQQKNQQQKEQQQQAESQEKQNRNDGREQPQPSPQQQKEEIEKKQAERLLMQYADDADDLNKPRKKMRAVEAGRLEKDW